MRLKNESGSKERWIDGHTLQEMTRNQLENALNLVRVRQLPLTPTQFFTWEMKLKNEILRRKNMVHSSKRIRNSCPVKRIVRNDGNIRYSIDKKIVARVSRVINGIEKKRWEAVVYEDKTPVHFQKRIEAEVYIHKRLITN